MQLTTGTDILKGIKWKLYSPDPVSPQRFMLEKAGSHNSSTLPHSRDSKDAQTLLAETAQCQQQAPAGTPQVTYGEAADGISMELTLPKLHVTDTISA